MFSSGSPFVFSIWLALFGCDIVIVALSIRRRRSNYIKQLAPSEKNFIISQLPSSDDNNDDIITNLPDDILISIISRVRTKDAVRTSVLSKKWANLYKYVPDIELRCNYLLGRSFPLFHGSDKSINAVDAFLRLRSGFKINSLNLHCCLTKSLHVDDRFEQFIYSLGRLGIERLLLQCSCGKWNKSDLLFSCHLLSQMPSLKYFDLSKCSLIQTPSLKKHFELGLCSLHQMPAPPKISPSNNSLQVLRLSLVDVSVGSLECVLANCLSLHALSLFGCKFHSKLRFCGPDLELRNVRINSCFGIEVIEFYASNLITLEIENEQVVHLVFDYVPKLQSVFLHFMNRNTMSCVCPKLVKDLSNVKSLIFFTRGHIYQFSRFSTGVNPFSSLRQLSLRLSVTINVDLHLLAPFLQRCPLLQEFHLDTEFLKFIEEQEVQSVPFVVAHPKLKKVEITGHGGTKPEIDFALYILKSAIELEEMQITRCPKWYKGCGMWSGRDKHPWKKHTLSMIRKRLQGQAISNRVRLTIQHSPLFVHTLDSTFIDDSKIRGPLWF